MLIVYLPDDGFYKAETCSIVLLNINYFVAVLWRILIKKFI
jgi:hypothetical protein